MDEKPPLREIYHGRKLAQRLLKTQGNRTWERAVAVIEKIRTLETDNGWSSAFASGFSDGQAARDRQQRLTAYVRVGIDDYAKGFRQGFFNRTGPVARSGWQAPLQIISR